MEGLTKAAVNKVFEYFNKIVYLKFDCNDYYFMYPLILNAKMKRVL